MIWSMSRFRQSGKLLIPVLKKAAFVLIPLSLIMWGLKYGVSSMHHLRFDAPEEFSMGIIISMGLGAFVFDTLLSLLWLVVATHATVSQAQTENSTITTPHLFSFAHQTLIEDLRKTMSVILWTFLFILPGVIRWIRLTFACLVALLNPSYQMGNVDALEKSSALVKGHGWALIFLVLLQVGLGTGLEEIGSRFPFFSPMLILFYGLAWLGSLYFSIYLTLTYVDLDPEVQL